MIDPRTRRRTENTENTHPPCAPYSSVSSSASLELRGRVVSIYMVAFRGGSPLGGLASGWLVTQVGSAPAVLMVNGIALASIGVFFLIRGHGLKDI